jgi:hypothetical protein
MLLNDQPRWYRRVFAWVAIVVGSILLILGGYISLETWDRVRDLLLVPAAAQVRPTLSVGRAVEFAAVTSALSGCCGVMAGVGVCELLACRVRRAAPPRRADWQQR